MSYEGKRASNFTIESQHLYPYTLQTASQSREFFEARSQVILGIESVTSQFEFEFEFQDS
jgi:hypothetical protein